MTTTRVALLALAALLALPGASLAHRPKTKTETVKVAGLERPAKVLRDTFGVPHVFAKSEHDAYFMVGYLHAQDRLFQMDSSRRQASGTLAELLGPSALEDDAGLRTFGLRRAAVRSLAAVSPQSRAVLDAYADGVNAWLATNPSRPSTPRLS
jgi:penicillin G amidase